MFPELRRELLVYKASNTLKIEVCFSFTVSFSRRKVNTVSPQPARTEGDRAIGGRGLALVSANLCFVAKLAGGSSVCAYYRTSGTAFVWQVLSSG